MTRRTALLFAALPLAAQKKNSKPPDVEVLSASARLEDGRVSIDARFKNVSAKQVRKLVVFFELLDSDGKVLTRQHGPAEPDVLEPGEEAGAEVQVAFHARAVSLRFEFEDGAGSDLRGTNAGPFPIEQ